MKKISLAIFIIVLVLACVFIYNYSVKIKVLTFFKARTKSVVKLFVEGNDWGVGSTNSLSDSIAKTYQIMVTNKSDIDYVLKSAIDSVSYMPIKKLSGKSLDCLHFDVYDDCKSESNYLFSVRGSSCVYFYRGGDFYYCDLGCRFGGIDYVLNKIALGIK